MSAADVHSAARSGFAAGAKSYGRSRAHYPESLQGWLQGTVGSGKSTQVMSQTGVVGSAQRIEVEQALQRAVAAHLGTRAQDEITLPYCTRAYCLSRR